MNGMAMKYGGRCPAGYGRRMYGGEDQMQMGLIPAPMAGMAMMVGLLIGLMIGKKKASHGMGMGMGYGGGDWMMRKKMMGKMGMGYGGMHHHHHGYGAPECGCGQGEGMKQAAEGEQGGA